jgi:hypothetical protein
MNTNASPASSLTPMLQGRTMDKSKAQMNMLGGNIKPILKEISEEKEEVEEKNRKQKATLMANLKGL